MPRVYNLRLLKERRQTLRKNQTEHERLLWQHLRDRRMENKKFIRQFGVGNYILDFYCPEMKLAIELDGSQHQADEQKAYDDERTHFLSTLNIKVLRFWNNDLMQNLEGVLETIRKSCEG